MPKTTCTEARAFIPSRAPLSAYRASEVVPPVGFAPSSRSCNAAPQATLSKKERRESEWATGKWRSCEPCSCRGFAQGWCCVGSTSLGVRLRFSARAGRPSADKQGQSSRPCPRPRQAGHQVAAALQWMARAALHPFREGIFYFFFSAGRARFLSWGRRGANHTAPHWKQKVSWARSERQSTSWVAQTKLVSKSSLQCQSTPVRQADRAGKNRGAFRYISLFSGNFFGSCVMKMSYFPNWISWSNKRYYWALQTTPQIYT